MLDLQEEHELPAELLNLPLLLWLKTDISFLALFDPHSGQIMSFLDDVNTIISYSWPQSSQQNSKMGI